MPLLQCSAHLGYKLNSMEMDLNANSYGKLCMKSMNYSATTTVAPHHGRRTTAKSSEHLVAARSNEMSFVRYPIVPIDTHSFVYFVALVVLVGCSHWVCCGWKATRTASFAPRKRARQECAVTVASVERERVIARLLHWH